MCIRDRAQHHQPLITVEISECDVRKEVIAKAGLGFCGECHGSRPGLSQLCNQIGRIGPPPCRASSFASFDFDTSGSRHSENQRLFPGGLRLFFRLRRPFDRFLNSSQDELFERDDMLNIFGDGPSVGSLVETPLPWSQPFHVVQKPCFTRSQLIQHQLPFV